MMNPIKIFYCYAREDRALRDELEKHLRPLKRAGQIAEWYDREILPGIDWAREIDSHLNSAQIVLLLISSDFMSSDYCYGVEMQRALARHAAGEAWVLPIIIRPVFWEISPIADLEVLPTDGIPVTEWTNQDKAFDDVARGIYRVVKALRDKVNALSEKISEPAHDTSTKENEQSLVSQSQQSLLQPDKSPSTFEETDASSPGSSEIDPVITPGQVQGPFEYTWPTLPPEKFTSGRWYQVTGTRRSVRLLVARTEREAWGKLRGRVVIFEGGRTENIKSLDPWVEFVETDDGEYACRIPDPKHPQATLKAGDLLPARFNEAKVLRADQVFRLLRNGPSLRLVVNGTDELAMIRHSYWMAGLRKKL